MMNCIRRTSAMSLVVVILLIVSLLTLHLPAACARHVVVLNQNKNGLMNNRGNENLGKALASTDDDGLAANKVISGRKLGVPNKEGTKATVGATATVTTTSQGSRPRTVKMRAAAKHGDAVTEMYNMLRRDYASRASRRRPINNGATPLQQVNKKP